ncbi:DNA replication protein [Cronobacter sakazakii]|nr:DNA replication protein [Cronobacter sakazakii]ELY2690357.1 DNA replication protein [Cronobacter sakazakii]ELY5945994.1 DNA replication protein [Cronobacter sakazakii]
MSKQLIQAIAHRDSQTLSRLASKYQPAQEHIAKVVVNTEAERLVDALFRQLKQVFPASAATNLRNESDEAAAKQQWILAFAENGITKREQLTAGMKRARASLSPFWPSPGQFIHWCREEHLEQIGLPTIQELVEMVHEYCARRGYFDSPEQYPWKHSVHYWMVTALYTVLKEKGLTESQLKKYAERELSKMTEYILNGGVVPKPKLTLKNKISKPLDPETALLRIKNIRMKYGLGRREARV